MRHFVQNWIIQDNIALASLKLHLLLSQEHTTFTLWLWVEPSPASRHSSEPSNTGAPSLPIPTDWYYSVWDKYRSTSRTPVTWPLQCQLLYKNRVFAFKLLFIFFKISGICTSSHFKNSCSIWDVNYYLMSVFVYNWTCILRNFLLSVNKHK